MMIDDRTPNFNLPLPNPQNLLTDDVTRIRDSISAVDDALHTQSTAITAISVDVSAQLAQSVIDNAQSIADANAATAATLSKIRTLALAGL